MYSPVSNANWNKYFEGSWCLADAEALEAGDSDGEAERAGAEPCDDEFDTMLNESRTD